MTDNDMVRQASGAIEMAAAALRDGGPVVLAAGAESDFEGSIVIAGEFATTESVAFAIRHTSGFLTVAMTGSDCDRLGLSSMSGGANLGHAVSVDASEGVSTGISAHDRALTVRVLADPTARLADLTRPGHVVPVRIAERGVLDRPAPPEAAVDLVFRAGLAPIAALSTIVSRSRPVDMAGRPEVMAFAAEHRLPVVTIDDLVAHCRRNDFPIELVHSGHLPFRSVLARTYRAVYGGRESEHIVVTPQSHEEPSSGARRVVVHAECPAGDLLGEWCCAGCLAESIDSVARTGTGLVVCLRGGSAPDRCAGDWSSVTATLAAGLIATVTDGPIVLETDQPHARPDILVAELEQIGIAVVDADIVRALPKRPPFADRDGSTFRHRAGQ